MFTLPSAERYQIFCGHHIEPWTYHDRPFSIDRSECIRLIQAGDPKPDSIVLIMAFDISAGTCRDATKEILGEVSFASAMTAIDDAISKSDHVAAQWDRARDERKNFQAAE